VVDLKSMQQEVVQAELVKIDKIYREEKAKYERLKKQHLDNLDAAWSLQHQITEKQTECNSLERSNAALKANNAALQAEIAKLAQTRDSSTKSVRSIKRQLEHQESRRAKLESRLAKLEKEHATLTAQVREKRNEVDEILDQMPGIVKEFKQENQNLKSWIAHLQPESRKMQEKIDELRSSLKKTTHMKELFRDRIHESKRRANRLADQARQGWSLSGMLPGCSRGPRDEGGYVEGMYPRDEEEYE